MPVSVKVVLPRAAELCGVCFGRRNSLLSAVVERPPCGRLAALIGANDDMFCVLLAGSEDVFVAFRAITVPILPLLVTVRVSADRRGKYAARPIGMTHVPVTNANGRVVEKDGQFLEPCRIVQRERKRRGRRGGVGGCLAVI